MKKILKSIALAGFAALAVLSDSNCHAASTGFNQTGAGPYDYNTAGNWVASTINGTWDTSLTLAATQMVAFATDTTLSGGLTFNYGGAFPLSLIAASPGVVNLTLGGDIGMSTTTNLNAANVTIGDVTNHININLGGATRTITVASNVLVLNDVISNGGITKAGAGNLKLQGTNTYDGVTTINAGSVVIRANNALGSTVGNTAIAANAGQVQLQNNIISPESITISGGNAVSPFLVPITSTSGSNTFTGNITYNAGATALTMASTSDNAWLNLNGTLTRDSSGVLNFNVGSNSAVVINNTINNQGGNLTIKGPQPPASYTGPQNAVFRLNISGNNFGQTQVRDQATLVLGADNAFNTANTLLLGVSGGGQNTDVGTLDLAGHNQIVKALQLTPSSTAFTGTTTPDTMRIITNSAASGTSTITVSNATAGNNIHGLIVDGANAKVALTMIGTSANVVNLYGTNTYTGPTTILGGRLALVAGPALENSSGSLSTGTSLFINSNATFDVTTLTTSSSTYTFTPASLTASGLGTNVPAQILGTSNGIVDMGAKPITLTWSGPSSGTNNGSMPLIVALASLNLNSNQFTVVVPGAALTDGNYQMVYGPNLTGSVNPTPLYTGGNGVATNYTGKIILVGTNSVYLSVSLNTYTVTYGTNNATSGTAPTDGNTYTNGQTVTVLANTGSLVRTGYTFAGWNTATNGSGTTYAATGSATFNIGPANVKLYPIWTSATPPSTVLTNSIVNGNKLVLSWPNGQGWLLESQTNSLSTGLGNNWVTNIGATSPFTNMVDPTKPTVFYRLTQ